MSLLGEAYETAYGTLCGVHPRVHPWHFQWLAVKDLYADLERVLPRLEGRVLDVGCREKPYEPWLTSAREVIGLDVRPGPKVDVVAAPGSRWPFEAASFDAVLCTQVLQYVDEPRALLGEIDRVLRPGGTFVLTVPFAYNEHAALPDYWRFSVHALERLVAEHADVIERRAEGGVGSTAGLLLLNWIETSLNLRRGTRLAKAAFLPVWIPICGAVNALGWLLDRADATRGFYSNVLLVASKRRA